MNIFDKRPLLLVLCTLILAFVIFSFIESYVVKAFFFLLLLAFLALSFIFRRSRLIKVILILSLVCFVFSFLYFELYFKAYNRYEGEVQIVGVVEKYENSSSTTTVHLSADNVDGTAFSSYDFILYLDRNEHYGFSIGSTVKLTGIIQPAGVGTSFDFESYYSSKGISGVIYYPESFEILDIGDGYPLEYKIYDYRQSISRVIIKNSRNADVGGLMCALLFGDRDYLPEGTTLDFTRIGITHILALSGSHLVILSLGLMRLLMRLGVKKKHSILIMIFFTLFYMILTGLSPSVVRASVMLIISSSMFLFARTKDSTTSLFASVGIIILATPYAIYDVALWLSAFATLGILVLTELCDKKKRKVGIFRYIFISFAASFFAIGATLAITTFTFDTTSILAAPATLIFTVLTEAFMYIGLLLLFFGSFLPVWFITVPLGNLIISLAEKLASHESLFLSTGFFPIYVIALLFSVLFFAFIILKIKHKRLFVSLILTIFLTYYGSAFFLTRNAENTDSVVYTSSDTEHITVTSSGEIMAIDIGNYNVKTAKSLYYSLAESNLTHIDKYVVTNYSYKLREMLHTLSDVILIDEIYLPIPTSTDEEALFFDASEIAESHGWKAISYLPTDTLTLGNAIVNIPVRYTLGSKEELLISVLNDGLLTTYANVGILYGENKNVANEVLGTSHAIIFGCHESKCRDFELIKRYEFAEKFVFSSGKLSLSENMMDYYASKKSYFNKLRVPLYVE